MELPPLNPDTSTLVSSSWHNRTNPLDVNASGTVTPADALTIVNYLNRNQAGSPPPPPQAPPPFYDVNDDGLITPADALRVVNGLNDRQGEGEPLPTPLRAGNPIPVASSFGQSSLKPSTSAAVDDAARSVLTAISVESQRFDIPIGSSDDETSALFDRVFAEYEKPCPGKRSVEGDHRI